MGEEESSMFWNCLFGGGARLTKSQIHRQAIMARANVSTQPRRAKGKNTMKFPYK